MNTKKRPHNSTYTQVGVQCFYESEVLNQSSVLLIKFSAKYPHLRVAVERLSQFDVSTYAAGCYMVHITNTNGVNQTTLLIKN